MLQHNLTRLLLIAISITCGIAIFVTPPLGDEIIYHAPMARNFSPEIVFSVDANYTSAYPPLPYFFGNLAWRVYPSLHSLRLLNLVVFLTVVLVFRLIALRICASPDFLILLFVLNPYLLKASFTYLMYNWGILFALVGLYLYFFKSHRFRVLAHLLFGMAVMSQQWMLAVVAAVLLHETMQFNDKEIDSGEFVRSILLKVVFLLPTVILFWRWGGLIHPNFASHSLYPTFEHLNAVLATLGLTLIFLVIFHWKRIFIVRNAILLIPLPLLWLAIPAHSQDHGPTVMTGLTSQLAVKVAALIGIPYRITMFALVIIGLASLLLLLSHRKHTLQQVMTFILLGLIVTFTASARLAVSHIFVCIPFAWLAFSDEIEEMGKAKYALIAQFFAFSAVYSIYIVFFRSNGVMF